MSGPKLVSRRQSTHSNLKLNFLTPATRRCWPGAFGRPSAVLGAAKAALVSGRAFVRRRYRGRCRPVSAFVQVSPRAAWTYAAARAKEICA